MHFRDLARGAFSGVLAASGDAEIAIGGLVSREVRDGELGMFFRGRVHELSEIEDSIGFDARQADHILIDGSEHVARGVGRRLHGRIEHPFRGLLERVLFDRRLLVAALAHHRDNDQQIVIVEDDRDGDVLELGRDVDNDVEAISVVGFVEPNLSDERIGAAAEGIAAVGRRVRIVNAERRLPLLYQVVLGPAGSHRQDEDEGDDEDEGHNSTDQEHDFESVVSCKVLRSHLAHLDIEAGLGPVGKEIVDVLIEGSISCV